MNLHAATIDERKSDEENNEESEDEEIMDTIVEAVFSQISEYSDRNNRSISISSSNSKEYESKGKITSQKSFKS